MFSYLLILVLQLVGSFNREITLAQTTSTESLTSPELSFFRQSPRLTRTATTYKSANTLSFYIFEIEIPEEAGNRLQKVVIRQQPNLELIRLFPNQTKAFLLNQPEQQIPIKVSLDRTDDQNELTINFLEPVSPGEKVRIKIRAINPLYGGIYQFGVTVFPQGSNPSRLYLGIGRFQFERNGDRL
jgi:hypothetical protein